MSTADNRSDRKMLLILSGVMLFLVVAICIIAPSTNKDDPQPTTYNSGSAGTKAAFLTLEALGRDTQRWNHPANELDHHDAANTTIIFTAPLLTQREEKPFATALQQFMQRGGRVLLIDADGALLPDGETAKPSMFQKGLCYTTPEGPSPLARAGKVEISEYDRWSADLPQFIVDQRCGKDAVVMHTPVGKGEAIWWSSATPLSNAGLKNDANLKLFLASIDGTPNANRTILFDEYTHTYHAIADPTKGLPLGWLELQGAILFLLLIVSFSRRRGPIRLPVTLPRSSPLEFAESMGDLYAKAGATTAATNAAERRFHRMLHREAGIARATIEQGPQAIGEALQTRLGGDWSEVADHLTQTIEIKTTEISPRSALTLIQAIAADETRIRTTLHPTIRSLSFRSGAERTAFLPPTLNRPSS